MKSKLMKRKLAVLATVLSVLPVAMTCLAQSVADKQEQYREHIQRAQEDLRAKRPDLAIPELQAAVKLDAERVDAQGNLGVLLFFQGKDAEAIPHLRAAVEKRPELSKIAGLLGLAEEHSGDTADARKDLESAFPRIEEKPFQVQVGLELVGLDTKSGELTEAAAVIAQLQKVAPEDAEVLYAAYRTYSELQAQSMLTLALAAPDSAQMHEMLAHEELKKGNTNGAVAEFHKAIAIDAKLPGVHFDLAELLKTSQNSEKKKEAQQEYRADLEQNPMDERAVRRMGEIDEGMGQFAQANAEFEKAVQMKPDDADANLDLANMLIRQGQQEKAQELLERVVQSDPTIALAHLKLSQLYRRKGMTKESDAQVELYKQYTALKDKLTARYKELQVQPDEILNGTVDAGVAAGGTPAR